MTMLSRPHRDTDCPRINMPGQPETRRKSEPYTVTLSADAETRDDVLSAEVRKLQIGNACKLEGNDGVLISSIEPLPILLASLMGRKPRVDLERGYTFTVEMKGKDLSVVERWPLTEPPNQGINTRQIWN